MRPGAPSPPRRRRRRWRRSSSSVINQEFDDAAASPVPSRSEGSGRALRTGQMTERRRRRAGGGGGDGRMIDVDVGRGGRAVLALKDGARRLKRQDTDDRAAADSGKRQRRRLGVQGPRAAGLSTNSLSNERRSECSDLSKKNIYKLHIYILLSNERRYEV